VIGKKDIALQPSQKKEERKSARPLGGEVGLERGPRIRTSEGRSLASKSKSIAAFTDIKGKREEKKKTKKMEVN